MVEHSWKSIFIFQLGVREFFSLNMCRVRSRFKFHSSTGISLESLYPRQNDPFLPIIYFLQTFPYFQLLLFFSNDAAKERNGIKPNSFTRARRCRSFIFSINLNLIPSRQPCAIFVYDVLNSNKSHLPCRRIVKHRSRERSAPKSRVCNSFGCTRLRARLGVP